MDPEILARSADRALLMYVFGTAGAEALASIPIYTCSELVLYVRGQEAYEARWVERTPRFPLVGALDATERTRREKVVAKALGVSDLSLQLAELQADRNVSFLIDTRLAYGEL